jgi:hypothetical protein
MLCAVAAICLAASTVPPAAPADSAASRKIVREFEPIVVEGGRRSDPGSIETVYTLPARTLRSLPVDRLVDAVALQAGVVAVGEDLHVRGGRTGELSVTTLGIPLNDPQWGRPMEVPLFAVRSVELLEGGLDADHQGALAGEMDVQTEVPTATPAWLFRWVSDVRLFGEYDAGLARATGPLGVRGLGWAVAGEARLDDLGLPLTRSLGRSKLLGARLGWREDNHLLAWAKIAPIDHPQRGSIEVLASHVVRAPYNPMFTFDGWVTYFPSPSDTFQYRFSEDPLDSTSIHYRAADHVAMTDERRVAIIAASSFGGASWPSRATLGWLRSTSLSSVGLRRDRSYLDTANRPQWGPWGRAIADPYHAFLGDEPYFRQSDAQRWVGRVDAALAPAHNQRIKVGGGLSYDDVRSLEIDDGPDLMGVDSLRSYHAFAPGGFAYVQHRWQSQGLIWNAGLRLQAFTAGPQAEGAHASWTVSPRLGFAYPVSDKDAFSASYSRIHQDPERDLLYESRVAGYNRHPLGNGALTPAEVISYQAAVKHILDPTWTIQVGVFYRDLYGLPGARDLQPNPYVFRLQYDNADDGHAMGTELAVRYEPRTGQHVELAYTYMEAWGTQSSPQGLDFGQPIGERPVPLGTHPLDWDQRHTVGFTALLHTESEWSLSWSTRLGTGLPWTPLFRDKSFRPPPYLDQSQLNTRRLSITENTDVTVRWAAKFLFGARAILTATNLFDNRAQRRVTLSGSPNPVINTLEDDYTAFYTETGLGGGAYFDDDPSTGSPGWIRVGDRRLQTRPRSIRFGVEIGH